MKRPRPDEHAAYYSRYIDQVPDGDVVELLEAGLARTLELLRDVSEDDAEFRYAPDKWSVKEVVGHVIDTERMFAYRGFCFAHAEPAALPSFEQEHYAKHSNATRRTLADLAGELAAVRHSSLALFRGWDEEMEGRTGSASGFAFTARSIPWIIAGHEIHHRRILEDKYLA